MLGLRGIRGLAEGEEDLQYLGNQPINLTPLPVGVWEALLLNSMVHLLMDVLADVQ